MLSDIVRFGSSIYSAYTEIWDWLFTTYTIDFTSWADRYPSGGIYDWPVIGDLASLASQVVWFLDHNPMNGGEGISISFKPIAFLTSSLVAILIARMIKSVS